MIFCLTAALLAEEYLSAASADSLANQARKACFFSLAAWRLQVPFCPSVVAPTGTCDLLTTALDHHFHNGWLEHGPCLTICLRHPLGSFFRGSNRQASPPEVQRSSQNIGATPLTFGNSRKEQNPARVQPVDPLGTRP